MWKRFNPWRSWRNSGLLLAFFLFSHIAQAATLDFTTQSWNRFVQQNKAAIVVFTSTDCSHCPAVVEALHQQLQNGKQGHRVPLHLVVMDGADEPEALQHGHYSLADQLWVFQGNSAALQYSVNSKWRGITPYIALVSQQQAEFILGKPDRARLQDWLEKIKSTYPAK